MSHRGKRSEEAFMRRRSVREEKRLLKRRLLDTSFRDREMAETICRTHMHFEGLIADFGDVLIDSRGRGSLQQIRLGGDKPE